MNQAVVENKPFSKQAKMQAAVIAQLKASNEPLTSKELGLHSSMQALNLKDNDHYSVLSVMHKAGLLRRVHIHRKDQPSAKYAYEIGDGQVTVRAPKSKMNGTSVMPVSALPPSVSVDLMKATGKLRINFRGLSIEIGVVDG